MGLAQPEFEHPDNTVDRREVIRAINRVAPDVIQDLHRRVDGLAPDELDRPVAAWMDEYHLNWRGIEIVARQTAEAAADPAKWASHVSRRRASLRITMINRKVAIDPSSRRLDKLAGLEYQRDRIDGLEGLPDEARRVLRDDVERQLRSPAMLATRKRFSEDLSRIRPEFNPEWCLKDDAPAQVGQAMRFEFHYDYLAGDLSFVENSTLDNAVLAAFKEKWTKERAELEEAYKAAGFRPVAEKRVRYHFDWFVAHQVLGEPFMTIARACRPTVVDETVRTACIDVADSIGAALDRRRTQRKRAAHESAAKRLRPRLEGTYQPPKVARAATT